MIPGNKFRFPITQHSINRRSSTCVLILLSIIVMMLITGCVHQPEEASARLGQEITLAPDQEASITGEPLKLQFRKVINDSRCPTGVTCVWEGEVSCLVDITYMNSTNGIVLTQRGSSLSNTNFEDYNIEFRVQPYPEASKTISPKDYRLELTIDK